LAVEEKIKSGADAVLIEGIFYGGQDFEAAFEEGGEGVNPTAS
jgi:hypothetical protein